MITEVVFKWRTFLANYTLALIIPLINFQIFLKLTIYLRDVGQHLRNLFAKCVWSWIHDGEWTYLTWTVGMPVSIGRPRTCDMNLRHKQLISPVSSNDQRKQVKPTVLVLFVNFAARALHGLNLDNVTQSKFACCLLLTCCRPYHHTRETISHKLKSSSSQT